jgi:hypothetical protein
MKREADPHVLSFFQSLLELKVDERCVEIEVEWSDS